MTSITVKKIFPAVLLGSAAIWSACSAAGKTKDRDTAATPAVTVTTAEATERPIARYIRVSGTLMAEEQAEVAAEIAGRVVSTPIERGTKVAEGAELIRLSPTESGAQLKEAEANAAQIEARLGLTPSGPFDVNAVPEVRNAKASYELAEGGGRRPNQPAPGAAHDSRAVRVGGQPWTADHVRGGRLSGPSVRGPHALRVARIGGRSTGPHRGSDRVESDR